MGQVIVKLFDDSVEKPNLNLLNEEATKCMIKYFRNKITNNSGIIVHIIHNYINKQDHSEKERKLLYNNILELLDVYDISSYPIVNKGSFGLIRSKGLKIIKIPTENPQDFFLEVIAGLLYQCYKSKIKELIPPTIHFRWPFPEIHSVFKSYQDQCVVVMMEKMAYTIDDLLDNIKYKSILVYKDVLTQLIVALYSLQFSIGFIHRDLHYGNVMVNFGPESERVLTKYEIEGESIEVYKFFEVFIIDLGQSCANISKCTTTKCEQIIIQSPAASYGIDPIEGCFFNNTYDLHLFCASMSEMYLKKYFGLYRQSSIEIQKIKKTLVDLSSLDLLMLDLYINAYKPLGNMMKDTQYNAGFHTIYTLLKNKKPVNIFYPLNLLKFLKKYN